jgi:phage-related protein
VSPSGKPLGWHHGEIKTPPFAKAARLEAGYLLRLVQKGQALAMPQSRPMPVVGARCHELRVRDREADWRIMYRTDADAVVILAVFRKINGATPQSTHRRVHSQSEGVRPCVSRSDGALRRKGGRLEQPKSFCS